MDRHLLTGAITIFIIELAVFMGDLGLWSMPFFKAPTSEISRQRIGEVVSARNNVRRRGLDSIVWEDSQVRDTLYVKDSVLTLKNSSVKLKLSGDVKLELDENTLVVLEPPTEQKDERLRLRFFKGVLASRSARALTLHAQDWSIDAKPGADLSIRQTQDGQLQVEVASGQVNVRNTQTYVDASISDGQRIQLHQGELGEVQSISEELKWEQPEFVRLYTHQAPVNTTLRWKGKATAVNAIHGGAAAQVSELKPEQTELEQSLDFGLHVYHLSDGVSTSKTLRVQVLPAPRLSYFSPLPRDRVRTGAETTFTWLKHEQIASYRLEIARDLSFKNSQMQNSPGARTQSTLNEEGAYFWHVVGVDPEGFEIPAPFAYPLFSVKNPLDRPLLAPPQWDSTPAREPAAPPKPKPKKDKSSRWEQIKKHLRNWIWPEAQAEEGAPAVKPSSDNRHLVFSWYKVPDADFYILEVAETPDFVSPVLSIRTTNTRYSWGGYAKKVYYYRVAAGRNDGRMGLFSDFDVIDVGKLALLKTEDLKPAPQIKKPEPEPPPLPPPEPPKTVVDAEEKLEKETQRRTEWILTYAPYYRFATEKAEENVEMNYAGANPFALRLESHMPSQKGEFFILDLRYAQQEYRSTDERLLGQEKMQADHAQVHLRYQGAKRRLQVGAWWRSDSAVERTGNESVALKGLNFFGLEAFNSWEVAKDVQLQLGIGLGTGSEDFAAQLEASLWTGLPELGGLHPFAGIGMSADGWSDFDKKSSIGTNFNLDLGVRW